MPADTQTFELSPQQEELWLAQPDGGAARFQAVATLRGPLDEAALRDALAQVVARHEILRTTFAARHGVRVPLQAIHDALEPGWETLDLTADATAQAALERARRGALEAPLPPATGPLLRALLARRGDGLHTLVLTASSLIADGRSLAILLRDLADAYAGREAVVPDPLQYADFAPWQRELESADDPEARAAATFWTAAAERAPSPPLPLTRPASGDFVPVEIEVAIDDRLAAAIADRARGYGTSVHAFVHTAWLALLARLTGEDAAVGYVGHERRHADLAGAIGPFARAVPVWSASRETFAETLDEIARAREDARTWQDHAPPGRPAAPAAGFVEVDWDELDAGGLRFSAAALAASGLPFRLWLTCERTGAQMRLSIAFDPTHLDAESAGRLASQLALLLESASNDPGAPPAALAILDADERARLLTGFAGPSVDIGVASVHDRIAERARQRPDEVAVIDDRGAISYRELEAGAERVAGRLRALGVGPDTRVGLLSDQSAEMVVGLLAILKAGGAYVPLHFEQPPARLAALLASTAAVALVAAAGREQTAGALGLPVVLVGDAATAEEPVAAERPGPPTAPGQLAYVIHTSGSTGEPKGVMVTHRNLANYATDIATRLGADREPLTFAVVTSSSTDLGNTALFGALCSGGTLLLVGAEAATDPAALAALAARTPFDVLKITPSHLRALLAAGEGAVLPRRRLVLGGERAPWDLIAEVRRLGGCEILNHYGPTETTIGSCTFLVPDGPGAGGPASVPIGHPIANTRCYVLDERREPVPIGVAGTLFISGAGVARGYLGAEALSAERFHLDPFVDGARMYDTGDIVRRWPDGALEFLGRRDEQVKIRGYRVEPGEIEAALRAHPAVTDAAVLADAGPTGDARLTAYCVADGAGEQGLREHLQRLLPEHMVPARITLVAEMPRTASGKIDRQALAGAPAPAPVASAGRPPTGPVEIAVAAIWSSVLGVERIGAHDDFFALGGHSLLATQVIARIRSEFAIDLPLHSVFVHLDVAGLAAEIVRTLEAADDADALISELSQMSDEEAARLLAEGAEQRDDAGAPR